MSTSNEHVAALIDYLAKLYMTVSKSSSASSATAYSNIIYGLQNCSCQHAGAAELLTLAMQDIDVLLQQPNLASLHDVMPTSDVLAIHQSLSLTMLVLPDLSAVPMLEKHFDQLITRTLALLQTRKSARDLRLQSLTVPEARLAATLQAILANEPLALACGDLLHGFECAAVVSLVPDLKLTIADGSDWSPVLNVEVEGTRSTRPVRSHFDKLRRRYLTEKHGVFVETIPAEAFNVAPGFQRNLLRIHPNLLVCFRPATEEDKVSVDAILRGGSSAAGGLLSTIDEQATLIMTHAHPSLKASAQLSNADMYTDDNLENSGVTSALGSNFAPRGVKVNYGMYVGWMGATIKCEVQLPNLPGSQVRLTAKTAVQQMPPHRPAMPVPPPYESDPSRHMASSPHQALPPQAHPQQQYKTSSNLSNGTTSSYGATSRETREGGGFGERGDNDESVCSSGEASRSTQNSQSGQKAAAPNPEGEVDIEIALLERQLEIARMETKLLELKKAKVEASKKVTSEP